MNKMSTINHQSTFIFIYTQIIGSTRIICYSDLTKKCHWLLVTNHLPMTYLLVFDTHAPTTTANG